MATLISNIDLATWQLGIPKASKQISIAAIRADGQMPRIQLAPKSDMSAIWMPFPPSVYGGTGSEPRKTIVLSITDDIRRHAEAIEEWAREALRPTMPAIDAAWHSVIKPATNYPASLRAKITLSGPGACTIVDEQSQPADVPGDWAGRCVIPLIEFRGVYMQKATAGLLLEVTGLMIGPLKHQGSAFVEFI